MNRNLKMMVAGSGMRGYEIENKALLPYTKLSRIIYEIAQPTKEEMERIAQTLGTTVPEIFPDESENGNIGVDL